MIVVARGASSGSLWLRWSWRDLRQHWIAVLSIAAVVAIGTGVYAGLGSTSAWRSLSNDTSFAALNMHDVRAQLSPGTFAPAGSLQGAARTIAHASWIDAADERLVVDSLIDATTEDETILVSARVVGANFDDQDAVDRLWTTAGDLASAEARGPSGVLEAKFADYYGLPSSGDRGDGRRNRVRLHRGGGGAGGLLCDGARGHRVCPR